MMRRLPLPLLLIGIVASSAGAQEGETEDAPRLRAPDVGSLSFESSADEEEEPEADEEDVEADLEDDSEEDTADGGNEISFKVGKDAPPASDPTTDTWTSPKSVFTLHGYLRVRGEFQDHFHLGRLDRPFSDLLPGDRGNPGTNSAPSTVGISVPGGCGSAIVPGSGPEGACETTSDRTRYADMRLRLQPTLAISDDVRIHMMVDVFDNLVLGSTADTRPPNATIPAGPALDSLTRTQAPATQGANALRDSIFVRRAWAEVTNRGLGQLRFGRMGHHWGLGMLWNSGEGIDQDFTSEVDRVQAITKFKGFFFGASWDFANEGLINDPLLRGDALSGVQGVPVDSSQKDDVRQWSFLVARRVDPERQGVLLQRGKVILNGGVYFVLRKQQLSSSVAPLTANPVTDSGVLFVRREAKVFIPDLWLQLRWKDLRLEVEGAMIAGRVRNLLNNGFNREADDPRFKLRQFGVAFEGEYRLIERKLGIYLNTGFGTGDGDVNNALSIRQDTLSQAGGNEKLSHFTFHPNYLVDLILFRRVLGAIGGAWYLAPGVSYDFFRSKFGQKLGARVDFIYSHAMRRFQTWGDKNPLGFETNLSLYYQTEEGPGFTDGYFIRFQYGILFPFQGLKFAEGDNPAVSVKRAQTLRLQLAVMF